MNIDSNVFPLFPSENARLTTETTFTIKDIAEHGLKSILERHKLLLYKDDWQFLSSWIGNRMQIEWALPFFNNMINSIVYCRAMYLLAPERTVQ